jgi:putative nucleotidyltransferase with HDIG domain
MRHHTIPQGFGATATERLAADLGLKLTAGEDPASVFDQLAVAFAGGAECSPELRRLATIVEAADQLDTEIEYLVYGDTPGAAIVRQAARDIFENPVIGALLPGFCSYSRQQLASNANRLPVFPAAALQVVRAARTGKLTATQLAELAAADPVLAGSVLSAANAAAYTWSGTVRNVQAAVLYLGDLRAAGVLLAAALKPVLNSAGSQEMWEHSLAAASVSEQLARMNGKLNPNDAYSIGLLHDVGKLLIELAPADISAMRQRLVRNGCATAIAEVLTCGASHAEAGADVLRHWALPAEYIEAVEFHHEPEHAQTPFASLLYLAEQCTGSDEDLPSAARMNHALKAVGLTAEQVEKVSPQSPFPQNSTRSTN